MEHQAAEGRKQRRHGLLMRWLLRAPVLVYRIGLGGLMPGRPMLGGLMPGHLMLTTVGRRSGRPHRVVVDMWEDTATDSYYVASGFGEYADWYRNLRANPEVRVQVGWRKFRARASTLPVEEAEELVLGRWAADRPSHSTCLPESVSEDSQGESPSTPRSRSITPRTRFLAAAP